MRIITVNIAVKQIKKKFMNHKVKNVMEVSLALEVSVVMANIKNVMWIIVKATKQVRIDMTFYEPV